MTKKIFLLLLIIISYSTSDTYYQLISKYSFNLKDKSIKSPLAKVSEGYYANKYISLKWDHLQMSPKQDGISSSLVSKGTIKSNVIDYQVRFGQNRDEEYGSFFSIWFYLSNNKDEHLDLNSKFTGFGIVSVTEPGESPLTLCHLILNPNNDTMIDSIINSMNGSDLVSDDPDAQKIALSNSTIKKCRILLKGNTKFYVRFDTGSIRFYIDAENDYQHDCFKYYFKQFGTRLPRVGIFTYNGENVAYDRSGNNTEAHKFKVMDQYQIFKISAFNMDGDFKEVCLEQTNKVKTDL